MNETINCQNCEAPVQIEDERCARCGAKLLHRRVFMGVPKASNFALEAEEPLREFDERDRIGRDEDWEFPARQAVRPVPGFPSGESAMSFQMPSAAFRWGGFFRRAAAFLLDVGFILILSALMAVMAYVGYKVGLSAHDRSLSWNNAAPLVSLLTFACVALLSLYFIIFHGMGGKTVGKWLLGLRVVGADKAPITYRRALLRWIATVGLGCASLGLAFLWIIWQREKRGWHDLVAQTWVIRE
jgi:uncharacterized RDD family membrane protein YckC